MNKNGRFFFSLVTQRQLVAALWDPHAYRHQGEIAILSDYVTLGRVGTNNASAPSSSTPRPFMPIEYKDVPGGNYLSFTLTPSVGIAPSSGSVAEEELLFGTMRAYLGNIIVTPRADWIGLDPPLLFSVKSEFVSIKPHDGLNYFWLIYLRSRSFLEHLPLGGGGTRPRLQPQIMKTVPVSVPDIETRKAVHDQIRGLASEEWQTQFKTLRAVNTFTEKL